MSRLGLAYCVSRNDPDDPLATPRTGTDAAHDTPCSGIALSHQCGRSDDEINLWSAQEWRWRYR